MEFESPYIGGMKPFSVTSPRDITFGSGCSALLSDKIIELGSKRPLFLTGRNMAKNARLLTLMDEAKDKGLNPEHWDGVEPEPRTEILEEAARFALEKKCDGVVAFGGGSSMDFGKIIAVMMKYKEIKPQDMFGAEKVPGRGVPTIMTPTTSGSGSEVSAAAILTIGEESTKRGIRSRMIVPDAALVDPALTVPLPRGITAASGIDALIHAIESYLSKKACAHSRLYALEAIKRISANLLACVEDGGDLEAREEQSYGSMLAGLAIAMTGTAAVHALSYPVGVRYGVSHGEACAVLLEQVMLYNCDSCAKDMAEIAKAMGVYSEKMSDSDAALAAAAAAAELVRDAGLKTRARDFGKPREPNEEMIATALKEQAVLANNPREIGRAEIEEIYEKTW